MSPTLRSSSRVFAWLVAESRDDRGDAIRYLYQAEDDRGVDVSAGHERNRGPRTAKAVRQVFVLSERAPPMSWLLSPLA